jgi:hypothetical protein
MRSSVDFLGSQNSFLVFIYIYFLFYESENNIYRVNQPLNITFFSESNVLFKGKKK